MRRYEYHRPHTLEEALRLKQELPAARYIAGGTDVMVQLRRGEECPPVLISLRSVAELRGINVDDGARIGALTPIGEIADHAGLRELYPALVEAAQRLGSPQIRSAATIGGNLCNASPCADTAPPLLVHEARVRLRGPGGERELPLEQLFCGPGSTSLAPGEILSEIVLDPPLPGTRSTFLKKGRVRMDLSLASVAALLVLEHGTCSAARLAAGAVAPVPLRLRDAEELLLGARITAGLVAAVGQAARRAISPISDLRSTAEYRRQIVGVYIRRALEALTGQNPRI